MRRVMRGESVKVRTLVAEVDRFGDEEPGHAEPVTVDGVLVHAATADQMEAARPYGMTATLSMAFPRSCRLDLRGALVTYGDEDYRVVGDPMHLPSPLEGWDMTVVAGRSDG